MESVQVIRRQIQAGTYDDCDPVKVDVVTEGLLADLGLAELELAGTSCPDEEWNQAYESEVG